MNRPKKNSIRISPEHGVNPSIAVCFFCGKDKGIAMLGKLKGDAKAPTRAIYDYKPCEECQKKLDMGTGIIEVTTTPNDTIPIKEGAWPTGHWCVVAKEAATRLFKEQANHKIILLEDSLYKELVK